MTDKVKRTLDNTRTLEEQVAEFRQNATAIIQSAPAVLLVAADPKNPEHGIISGGIGNRDKMLEILAASLIEDRQFRKLFEEAYRAATVAMIKEDVEVEQEMDKRMEQDAVVVPFRIPITKNLQ